jgi:hypothetical protein
MSVRKAAVLIGLTFVVSGVCDANAATTTPVTDTFSLSAGPPPGQNPAPFEDLSFPQFNPSLGTLTSVDFSLNSSLSGPSLNFNAALFPAGLNAAPLLGFSVFSGPFDFTDISGLGMDATTGFYTGTSTIAVRAALNSSLGTTTWTGNGTGQGLTLVYDYTPVVTPLPAALPLFATSLGALGLLGWRRKRRAQAVA